MKQWNISLVELLSGFLEYLLLKLHSYSYTLLLAGQGSVNVVNCVCKNGNLNERFNIYLGVKYLQMIFNAHFSMNYYVLVVRIFELPKHC